MDEGVQTGWTRVFAGTGRYEYQFQGRTPTVRNGSYEDARDYQFLVIDEERWLYKIPVRVTAEAESILREGKDAAEAFVLKVAEAQLRAGLENYRPRQNVPYGELDTIFSVDAARAIKLSAGSL
jgi:hypothetical protein